MLYIYVVKLYKFNICNVTITIPSVEILSDIPTTHLTASHFFLKSQYFLNLFSVIY